MENGTYYSCDFSGAVAVNIAGTFWSRTWWSMGGASVTEFAPVAKAGMGSLNTKFDDDQALWLASLPPPQPPCPTC